MPLRNKKEYSKNLLSTRYTDHRVDLYRQMASELRTRDSGLSRYVIDLFGPDLIGSLAFAIDPYKQFTNRRNNVTLLSQGAPFVRSRRKPGIRPSPRKLIWKTRTVAEAYKPYPQGGSVFYYIYTGPETTTNGGTQNRASQPIVYAHSRDTTRRTRQKGSAQGEFEIFYPTLRSPEHSYGFHKYDRLHYLAVGNGQRSTSNTYRHSRTVGPEFRVTDSAVQALLPVYRTKALAAMQENVMGMLDRVQPSHRSFDLVRQIAELRDLPQTLRGTLEIWLAFERTVGVTTFRNLVNSARAWRNPEILQHYHRILGQNTGFRFNELLTIDQLAGSAYLTFKFGWESMLRGISDFLPSPHRVARQINYLISRIGKDTSFRTRKSWIENETSVPLMTFDPMYEETIIGSPSISGHRKIELRLMANFNINFPHADIPRLRRELYLRKLGASPTPSDVYNLIPWTWLGDWFLGAGDYLELIGTIANDRSLINYGFISCKITSEVDVSVKGRFTKTVERVINGVRQEYDTYTYLTHTGKLKVIYHLRRSIPSLTDVKSVWDSNLNSHQTAILGALFSSKFGSLGLRVAS